MQPFTWNVHQKGNASLPAMIWFHGFMGSSQDWGKFLPEFPEYCHYLVDLPGHSDSALAEPVDHECLMPQLYNTLSSYNLTSPILVGYSMGARVALWLDHLYPDLAKALIILSGAPGLRTLEEQQARLKADSQLMEKWDVEGPEAFLCWWYSLPLFGTLASREEFVQKLITTRKGNNPDWLRNALMSLGNGALPSLWSAMKQGRTPLLMGTGEQDRKYVSIQQEIMEARPTAEGFTISGTSHAFHLEKPVETASAIKQFLGSRTEGD